MVRHIGERVRAVRKRRALTQMELASEAGLSVDTISKVENGLHEPPPSHGEKTRGGVAGRGRDVDCWRGVEAWMSKNTSKR